MQWMRGPGYLLTAVCASMQLSAKVAEGGDKAAVSAVDVAKQIADRAEPMAERINMKIEKEAHNLSANAEFHASDVADEYQKGAKVTLRISCFMSGSAPGLAGCRRCFRKLTIMKAATVGGRQCLCLFTGECLSGCLIASAFSMPEKGMQDNTALC